MKIQSQMILFLATSFFSSSLAVAANKENNEVDGSVHHGSIRSGSKTRRNLQQDNRAGRNYKVTSNDAAVHHHQAPQGKTSHNQILPQKKSSHSTTATHQVASTNDYCSIRYSDNNLYSSYCAAHPIDWYIPDCPELCTDCIYYSWEYCGAGGRRLCKKPEYVYCDDQQFCDNGTCKDIDSHDVPFGSTIGAGHGACVDMVYFEDGHGSMPYGELVMGSCHGGSNQQFYITPEGYIKNLHDSSLCMTEAPLTLYQEYSIPGGNDFFNVRMEECTGLANQNWESFARHSVGGGVYTFKFKTQGWCLGFYEGHVMLRSCIPGDEGFEFQADFSRFIYFLNH